MGDCKVRGGKDDLYIYIYIYESKEKATTIRLSYCLPQFYSGFDEYWWATRMVGLSLIWVRLGDEDNGVGFDGC